ncbi:hypothetical protein PHAVU_005G073500 [Phaseolus vulgaris]|uniref:Uncharacterized protein n=1 Tax=Phaseolus vulgaris TaxID=3885 RepID=V7BY18_PHAVU|nr:hypothetical protein PHAVU_005G073500g [Phaseolus vulgaris]ESW21471.1 hypothetical protein PHAVU_005G073500g [Phaseolus vulgaris]
MLNYLSLTHTLSLKSWHYIESDTSGIQWTLLDKEKAVKSKLRELNSTKLWKKERSCKQIPFLSPPI